MSGFVFYHPKLGEKRNKLLEEAFKGLDLNDDGRISLDEILTVFQVVFGNEIKINKENGVNCSREEVETIFHSADRDASGKLSLKEFSKSNKGKKVSASTQEKSSQEQAQQAQMAFKLYDRDKDGYITKAEMIKISKTLTKDQVEKAFSKFDTDGDGKLSYEEFKKMMNK